MKKEGKNKVKDQVVVHNLMKRCRPVECVGEKRKNRADSVMSEERV